MMSVSMKFEVYNVFVCGQDLKKPPDHVFICTLRTRILVSTKQKAFLSRVDDGVGVRGAICDF